MPKVRIVEGPKKGKVIDLRQGPNVIGRTDDAHITLPSTQVSRKHACLTLANSRVFIEDLKSSNGTFVNGARIQKVEIRRGNKIQVGEYGLEVIGDREGSSASSGGKGKKERKGSSGSSKSGRVKSASPINVAPLEQVPLFWKLYAPLKFVPWSVQMFLLTSLVGLAMIFGVVYPLLTKTENAISQEALKRASAVVGALAMKNGEFIKTRNDIRFDTRGALENEGVTEAYLLSRDLDVLSSAPSLSVNSRKKNALTLQLQSRREEVILEASKIDAEGRGGTFHLGAPVRVWSADSARYDVVGYAYIVFRADQVGVAGAGKVGTMGLYGALIGFVLLLALTMTILLTNKPIASLRDDAELALRGDISEVKSKARFKALEGIAHTFNRSIARANIAAASSEAIPESSQPAMADASVGPAASSGGDDLGDAKVEAIAAAVSQGVLILDDMQRVVFVNQAMEKLLKRATASVQGRHVMEAVSEPQLLGTVLDLFKEIMTVPGSVATRSVNFEGRDVSVVVSGVLNQAQELKYAAVVVG